MRGAWVSKINERYTTSPMRPALSTGVTATVYRPSALPSAGSAGGVQVN